MAVSRGDLIRAQKRAKMGISEGMKVLSKDPSKIAPLAIQNLEMLGNSSMTNFNLETADFWLEYVQLVNPDGAKWFKPLMHVYILQEFDLMFKAGQIGMQEVREIKAFVKRVFPTTKSAVVEELGSAKISASAIFQEMHATGFLDNINWSKVFLALFSVLAVGVSIYMFYITFFSGEDTPLWGVLSPEQQQSTFANEIRDAEQAIVDNPSLVGEDGIIKGFGGRWKLLPAEIVEKEEPEEKNLGEMVSELVYGQGEKFYYAMTGRFKDRKNFEKEKEIAQTLANEVVKLGKVIPVPNVVHSAEDIRKFADKWAEMNPNVNTAGEDVQAVYLALVLKYLKRTALMAGASVPYRLWQWDYFSKNPLSEGIAKTRTPWRTKFLAGTNLLLDALTAGILAYGIVNDGLHITVWNQTANFLYGIAQTGANVAAIQGLSASAGKLVDFLVPYSFGIAGVASSFIGQSYANRFAVEKEMKSTLLSWGTRMGGLAANTLIPFVVSDIAGPMMRWNDNEWYTAATRSREAENVQKGIQGAPSGLTPSMRGPPVPPMTEPTKKVESPGENGPSGTEPRVNVSRPENKPEIPTPWRRLRRLEKTFP